MTEGRSSIAPAAKREDTIAKPLNILSDIISGPWSQDSQTE